MCGIYGICPVDGPEALRSMGAALAHRGPDDEGELFDPDSGLAMGMRRLSIIDLEHGHQPISNEDQTIWVVCNGEIYNSPELRRRLIAKGHQFRTENSDVEVLVHLYEESGPGLVHELNGMYAFVIFDQQRNILFGARDRLGIKPLYYHHREGRLQFASELKALLQLPEVVTQLDHQSLSDYLSLQYIPAPRSPFLDIAKLPAGHRFVYKIKTGNLDIQPYWELEINPVQRSRDEWLAVFREQFRDAAARWTLSDVPIGISLSGGIDSSALAGVLAAEGIGEIRTFSVGFEGAGLEKYDELPLAREVAKRWHTKHIEYRVNPQDIIREIGKMVYSLDEPYGGGLPSWFVYQCMSSQVKVGLTGTGGDELFGNYGKARRYRFNQRLRPRRLAKAIVKNRSLAEAVDLFRFPRASAAWMYFRDHHKRRLLFKDQDAFRDLRPTEELIESVWRDAHTDDPRDVVPLIDFNNQLPEEFLHVTDRFSMAHSIEARVPFLDHQLVETVMQIPADIRVSEDNPKQFLLDAVRDLLPDPIIRSKKRGFVLPLKEWTQTELREVIEHYLGPDHLSSQGIFSQDIYKRIVRPHLTGQRDQTDFVWTLLMFQLWYAEYLSAGKGSLSR